MNIVDSALHQKIKVGVFCIAEPRRHEPDLLIGKESFNLVIETTADETVIQEVPPPIQGWTHQTLNNVDILNTYGVIELYLTNGTLKEWIGSSEI